MPPMTIPTGDTRGPELMSMVSREEIDELFGIFFEHSESTRKILSGPIPTYYSRIRQCTHTCR